MGPVYWSTSYTMLSHVLARLEGLLGASGGAAAKGRPNISSSAIRSCLVVAVLALLAIGLSGCGTVKYWD